MMSIDNAKAVLRDAGYFVENLWQVDDVKKHYICENDDAQYILENALTSEATMNQIWSAIHIAAENENLTFKEEK